MRQIALLLVALFVTPVFAVETSEIIGRAEHLYESARVVCSGISDEIARVSNVSKANTAVTTVGTVAAAGALAAGIAKSEQDKEINLIAKEICDDGGCTPEGVAAMSDEEFFNKVIVRMSQIYELQKKTERSKNLGNWRTGLMAGTIGTNVASAIIAGLNKNQSELIQHIDACNQILKSVTDMSAELKQAGINPYQNPIVNKLDNVSTWCGKIELSDIEKIEKRMGGVMGVSVAGGVIGVAGVATSAAANSDKYNNAFQNVQMTETERDNLYQKQQSLNTAANILAGANVVTGATETGLNISLITLTKKLINRATECERVFE